MNYHAIVLACVLPALTGAAAAQETIEVSQEGRRFHPEALEVAPGTEISVLNDDRFTHHVFYEENSEKFDSGEQPPGETVRLRMDRPGQYEVQCAIHPKMRLTVTVAGE